MSKPTFILALDAGHYLATPGKRCLKSLDPGGDTGVDLKRPGDEVPAGAGADV